jgi:hypothetical protein
MFGPRIDVLYTIELDAYNASKPHDELSCKLICDTSNLCVALTHNTDELSCIFYDLLGPVELKVTDPVSLLIKSVSCVIPHVFENEGRGCVYTERLEQQVVMGSAADVITLTNVSGVVQCSEACDSDGMCRIFDYDSEFLSCRFYRDATEWVTNTFYFGYVKNDPFCVIGTAPSTSPTDAPTTQTPTNAPTIPIPTSAPTISVVSPYTIDIILVILIPVYAMVCCVACFFALCVDRCEDEMYVIVPDSIAYTIEF